MGEAIARKSRAEGRTEGMKEGIEKRSFEVATDMIRDGGMSGSFIAKISKLSEDAVRQLTKSLNMAVL